MLIKRLFMLTVILICTFNFSVSAGALGVSAKAAALIEVQSGDLIYGKNENQKMSMASTTKIMTALLAIEAGVPNRIIKVNEEMLQVEGTSMGLLPDDEVSIKCLMYGMLLASGNDAANATAITIGGSTENFVKMMNKRAKQIGMQNTNFVTPSGLDADEHYSTAYDMALLGAVAVSNPEFRAICSAQSIRVSYGNPPYERSLYNHNRLLKSYDGAIGIKTGYTKKSGRCLVSAAERNGVLLVAVTLNDHNDWADHKKLFDYGFSLYKNLELDSDVSGYKIDVVGGKKETVSVACATAPTMTIQNTDFVNVTREIYLDPFVYAPVDTGKIVGTAKYYANGKLICEEPLVTAKAVKSKYKIKVVDESNKEDQSFFEKIRSRLFN